MLKYQNIHQLIYANFLHYFYTIAPLPQIDPLPQLSNTCSLEKKVTS